MLRTTCFGDTLVEDYNLRKFLKKKLYDAGVAEIEIERDATKVRIHISLRSVPVWLSARAAPRSRSCAIECEKLINKDKLKSCCTRQRCRGQAAPTRTPSWLQRASLRSSRTASSFRRAMKQAISRAMRLGARGIKVQVSGRLGGAEIARVEQLS